ncbi:MAG TPA: hypothetical protein VMU55_04185 [Solirubrobacteraceae bacterium]|nr:hypothetical protein [Solirubrobacteraceae bacterium]
MEPVRGEAPAKVEHGRCPLGDQLVAYPRVRGDDQREIGIGERILERTAAVGASPQPRRRPPLERLVRAHERAEYAPPPARAAPLHGEPPRNGSPRPPNEAPVPGGLDHELEGKRPLRELGRAVSRPHDFVEPLSLLSGEYGRSGVTNGVTP